MDTINYYKTISGLIKWLDLSNFGFLEMNPLKQGIYKGHLITEYKNGNIDVSDPKYQQNHWLHFSFTDIHKALEFIDERSPD